MQIYEIPVNKDQKEETQHGEYDFPMAIYEDQMDKFVLGYVNWHWHDEVQFIYITQGRIQLFAEKDVIVLEEGDGAFINSGVLHKICPDALPGSGYICLDIHEKMFSGYTGSRIGQKYVVPYLQDGNLTYRILRCENEPERQIIGILQDIYQLYKTGKDGWELDVQIKLLECWKSFIGLTPAKLHPKAAPKETERLKQILQMISQQYSEKLTLEDFAEALHLSAAECCRLFKRQMHCTIFEYLADYRIEKSLQPLQYSDASVSTIAYDCGFASTSYYIKRFREKTGMTPLEFRKQK